MTLSIWDQILARVETKVNRHSFYTWFKPTGFVSDGGATITVRVPSPVCKDWLTKHYSGVLSEALADVKRSQSTVVFVSDGSAPPSETASPAPAVPQTAMDAGDENSSPPAGLNPRYSFDTFIVGP